MIFSKQTLGWLSLLSVLLILTGIGFAGDECTAVFGTGTHRFSLATGSPGELGLVEALAKEFNRLNETGLCWVKAGSGASLKMLKEKKADADGGYFMTDSSTWVAAKKELPNLKILFRGDPMLINTYHGLCQPPGATTAQPSAAKFIAFVASEEGQKIIRAYGRDLYGDSLYNDAKYASQYDH